MFLHVQGGESVDIKGGNEHVYTAINVVNNTGEVMQQPEDKHLCVYMSILLHP